MIQKSYKYRLYPNKEQSNLLDKHFGCVRFVYNWALGEKTRVYQEKGENLSRYQLQRQLPVMKKTDKPWLAEVNAQSLQCALINLDRAYLNFFRNHTKFPKFKKKGGRQSFQVPQKGQVDFVNNKLFIPKFLEGIRCKASRHFSGEPKTFTVSKHATGKYFVSVLVETPSEIPPVPPPNAAKTVGLDMGVTTFCTLSTGEKIDNPKFLKASLKRLSILQRRASRKKEGGNNRKKAVLRVARLCEKIRNRRNDFLHKLTHRLTNENQAGSIAIEDLYVSGMMKNHRLAQSIADASWGEFFRQLEYKAGWRGVNLLKIGRFEPSSRMCTCGTINRDLSLGQRKWTCKECGSTHDRDILAAQNIKRFALVSDNLKYTGAGCPSELVEMRCNNGGR